MREQFEQRSSDLEAKYDRKMSALRDELELRRKTEVHEVEEVICLLTFFNLFSLSFSLSLPLSCKQRKNAQINQLMKNHEKAFSDIKNYYNDITLNNLALINSLKVSNRGSQYMPYTVQEQVETMKKDQERLEKQLSETQAEKRRLQEPLQKVTDIQIVLRNEVQYFIIQAREELLELQKRLSSYERDKVSLQVST